MMTVNKRYKVILNITLLAMLMCAFTVKADSTAIKDKIAAISIEGIEVTEIKETDKKILIKGTAKENKLISAYLRQLDDVVGSPNLEQIKRDNNLSVFSISIKK